MALSHSDIRWCSNFRENVIIIDRCGEFPNVPLTGIRGGITYNPALALRQFGHARRDGPHEMIIQGIVFDYDNDSQGLRQTFVRAWGMVKRSNLGKKNSIPMEPYLRWVRARAREFVMPYLAVGPLIVESSVEGGTTQIISYPDIPTDVEELKRSWTQLREERDTFETQFNAERKKVLELTSQLNEERRLNAYLRPKRSRPWET
jgi:hypothetical protein